MHMDRCRIALLACVLSAFAPWPVAQASAPAHREDVANWAVISGWVKELPEGEQTIVLVLLALGLDQHLNQKLLPVVKDRAGFSWAMKVVGNGNNMLQGVATRSPQMRQLLQEKADLYLEVINIRIGADDFEIASNAINKRIMDSTEHVQKIEIDRVRAAYRSRIAETETALIAYAVVRSTDP